MELLPPELCCRRAGQGMPGYALPSLTACSLLLQPRRNVMFATLSAQEQVCSYLRG